MSYFVGFKTCKQHEIYIYLPENGNKWTSETRQMKFCIEIDHKHAMNS
jgi:hypothetical protein